MGIINFVNHISNYIGETVTIYTTSGGESGLGFTGVILSINPTYVRLITQIGSAPSCALGNCCLVKEIRSKKDAEEMQDSTEGFDCSGRTVGSVTDIPIEKIVAFVHNAV